MGGFKIKENVVLVMIKSRFIDNKTRSNFRKFARSILIGQISDLLKRRFSDFRFNYIVEFF